jgi:hypothetical protein
MKNKSKIIISAYHTMNNVTQRSKSLSRIIGYRRKKCPTFGETTELPFVGWENIVFGA